MNTDQCRHDNEIECDDTVICASCKEHSAIAECEDCGEGLGTVCCSAPGLEYA